MDSKIPPHEIDGSIYYKFETYNGFDRLSVSGFIFHSYSWIYLANIFRGRIEYELIYSLRGAKHRVDYSVHIR